VVSERQKAEGRKQKGNVPMNTDDFKNLQFLAIMLSNSLTHFCLLPSAF
jgi:hypothetical protein